MMTIFDAALTNSFQGSTALLLSAERLVVDFVLTIDADAVVEWYLAFTPDDPNNPGAVWRREIAEEDTGGGQVGMPIVVRTFQNNGGGALPAGTHAFSAQFVRAHNIAKVYVRASSGTVSRCVISAPFGAAAVGP